VAGAEVRYLRGLSTDETLCRFEPDGTAYYISDALSSTVALTDANGAVITAYTYDPFGLTMSAGTSNSNLFQYTGRENEGPLLHYYRARYYSPQLHRFISPDPLLCSSSNAFPLRSVRRNTQLLNAFAYAFNSPTNRRDPLGLSPECAYYDQRCAEVTGPISRAYYCKAAKYVCENAGRDAPSNCYRECLQDWDRAVCRELPTGRKDPTGLVAIFCTEIAGHIGCTRCFEGPGSPLPPR
jgi:RHS repeat-associated protein